MEPESPAPASKTLYWTGWVLSILPSLLLLFSGVMKLMKPPGFVEGFEQMGYGAHLALPIGLVEIACTLLYLFPRTAVLGAILLTGYMGGAIATHVRAGDHFFIQAGIGVVIWLGICLREPRLWKLIPWRR